MSHTCFLRNALLRSPCYFRLRFASNELRSQFVPRPAFLPIPTCYVSQKREFSLRGSVESVISSQIGIFKFLSESTPVAYFQSFLVQFHEYSGLPWWATIVASTVLLRACVTFPLAIYQHYILAKLENLNLEMPDIVKQLKFETAVAIKKFGWNEREAKAVYTRSINKQWNALIIRDNCHPFKASLLIWVQLPMWVFLSISIRNLVYMLPAQDVNAQIIFAELALGGFGWIPNLTIPDSSWILPVMMGLTNLTIIEIQTLSKIRVPTKFQKVITNIFRGFTIVLVPIAAGIPSAVCLYWVTSSVFGLVQNLVLMSPKVKRFCGIPLTASELEQPYTTVWTGLKHKFSPNKNANQ